MYINVLPVQRDLIVVLNISNSNIKLESYLIILVLKRIETCGIINVFKLSVDRIAII